MTEKKPTATTLTPTSSTPKSSEPLHSPWKTMMVNNSNPKLSTTTTPTMMERSQPAAQEVEQPLFHNHHDVRANATMTHGGSDSNSSYNMFGPAAASSSSLSTTKTTSTTQTPYRSYLNHLLLSSRSHHDNDDASGQPSTTLSSSSSSSSSLLNQKHPTKSPVTAVADLAKSRTSEAARQLFCGGLAGAVAKTVTAPLSRLTILFQVHSMVTTKGHRPKFAITLSGGLSKMIERGGILSLWKGNMTSVLHRFPYSAINFYVYEHTMDLLAGWQHHNNNNHHSNNNSSYHPNKHEDDNNNNVIHDSGPIKAQPTSRGIGGLFHLPRPRPEEKNETQRQVVRRLSRIVMPPGSLPDDDEDDEDDDEYHQHHHHHQHQHHHHALNGPHDRAAAAHPPPTTTRQNPRRKKSGRNGNFLEDTPASHKFLAGAVAGTTACLACYPLDLVRTRLTTELEGQEHYKGIVNAFSKIARTEGLSGFYSGVIPTLLVAVPNFAISYTVYGTLKEYTLDDELFYNLRKIDADSGEPKLGLLLTVLCGAASGSLGTMLTFPMDTIRRRMQIQNLHTPEGQRKSSRQLFSELVHREGLSSLYRGLTPELLKVIPMVSTMFLVYEWSKDLLDVGHNNNNR